jgi:asparagine synthase (glutamine-hydrolysing)
MCGLTGFLNFERNQTADEMQATVDRMAETLKLRGPDDRGIWCDPASGIAFGFRRLSIVDLSTAGHQPMTSSCGRFVIVFNGEIFNHDELRRELSEQGHSFRGHSDTEVLIEGFAEWGIETTVRRAIGMFAIAVWDTQNQELSLIRDRMGKKPLYYGRFGPTFLFGSEIKALRAHPAFQAVIDRDSIAEFLKQSYLSDRSVYSDVMPLHPGESLTVRLNDDAFWHGTSSPAIWPFWSFSQIVTNGIQNPFNGSYEDAVDQLDELLTDAVGRRMVAEVPLGAFLSGGIDSSLVVALMQKQSSRPVKTFTIGFEEKAYNEAPYAHQVAKHLKTDHTEMIVTSSEAMDVIPLLPKLFDEPFADSSQIPTYLVSRLARQHVTVALSGDGGDELFCGYRRYFESLDGYFRQGPSNRNATSVVVEFMHWMPPFIRAALVRTCRIAGKLPLGRISRLMTSAAGVVSERGPHDRYQRNLSHWRHLEDVVKGLSRHFQPPQISQRDAFTTADQYQQVWQSFDTLNYLPGDILTKVDRASMGVSLEARTPLLDHRVVEFAWSLPHEFKVQGRSGKRILRDVLAKYVPRELFERPKVGFGIPIGDWLRGSLREWAEELIDERRLQREGFFYPQPIRQKWSEHLSGRTDWSYLLWDVLMFQTWLAEYP